MAAEDGAGAAEASNPHRTAQSRSPIRT